MILGTFDELLLDTSITKVTRKKKISAEDMKKMVLSLHQPALNQDLSFPKRNRVGVFCLLLVAHVSIDFGFEIKSENRERLIL